MQSDFLYEKNVSITTKKEKQVKGLGKLPYEIIADYF